MLKKSITFEDFNGNEVTEDHYFHLSKADLVEMEVSQKGGLAKRIEKMMAEEDAKGIMETFKDLILRAYGQKSEDGRRFIKSPALEDAFLQSPAYDALFMELVTSGEAAAHFVNSVIPQGLEEMARKMKSTSASAETDRVNRPGLNPDGSKVEGPPPKPDLSEPSELGASPDPEPDTVAALDKARNVFNDEEYVVKTLTQKEIVEMDAEELKSGLASGKYKLPQ